MIPYLLFVLGAGGHAGALSSFRPGLDVNDVSVLFSRAESGAAPMYPALDLASLWPKPAFDAMLAFAAGRDFEAEASAAASHDPDVQGAMAANPTLPWRLDAGTGLRVDFAKTPEVLSQANWRVVGLRIDPCAGAMDAACGAELRLVAEPFRADGGDLDYAAHLVFRLPRVDRVLADELFDLQRVAAEAGYPTAGQALGVHPALAGETKHYTPAAPGPFGTALVAFIRKHAAKGPDVVTAAMQGHVKSQWLLFQGKIVGQDWVPLPITGGNHQMMIGFDATKSADGLVPPPQSFPSLQPLYQLDDDAPVSPAVAALPWRLDDPGRFGAKGAKVSVHTADCLSCHATFARAAAHRLAASDPAPRAALYVPAPGITGYPGAAAHRSVAANEIENLRAFGVFFGEPTASMRTVNESAEAARYFNETVLPALYGRPFANPGFDCHPGASEGLRRRLHGALLDCVNRGRRPFAACAAELCSRSP